jgi:hypothetical protein
MLALDVILKVTLARWQDTHREEIKYWLQCSKLMKIRFGSEEEKNAQNYTREIYLVVHIEECKALWNSVLEIERTHRFIHILDTILKNWYW